MWGVLPDFCAMLRSRDQWRICCDRQVPTTFPSCEPPEQGVIAAMNIPCTNHAIDGDGGISQPVPWPCVSQHRHSPCCLGVTRSAPPQCQRRRRSNLLSRSRRRLPKALRRRLRPPPPLPLLLLLQQRPLQRLPRRLLVTTPLLVQVLVQPVTLSPMVRACWCVVYGDGDDGLSVWW